MKKKAKKRCKAIIKRHTPSSYKQVTMLLRFYQKHMKPELCSKEQANYFFLPCGDGKNGKEKLVEYIKEIKL